MNLRTTRTITWTEPPSRADMERLEEWKLTGGENAELAGQIAPARQVRATVATLNALQHARYQANLRTARGWIEQEAPEADESTRLEYLDVCIKWAAVLASLVKLERRSISRTAAENAESDWGAIDTPEEWRTPAGWLENVPAELVAAVYVAVLDLNPGLFGWGDESGDAKKNRKTSGGVFVE